MPRLYDWIPAFAGMTAAKIQENFEKRALRFIEELGASCGSLLHKTSIGLLLCRSKNKLVVEYALRNFKKPIGVAEWETKIVKKLPAEFKGSLPTVEEIEAELTQKGSQE